jgi:enamine deaminase RidA (YjgF/YER057c/UK114 family)
MKEAQGTAGDVGKRHRPRGAVVEEAEASFPDSLEETGATLVW